MLGRMGTNWRRRACGPLLLAAVTGLGACGDGTGTDMVRAAVDGDHAADDGAEVGADPSPPSTIEGATLLDDRNYDVGDCVMWPEGLPGEVETEVVDCTELHRIQIAERVDGPDRDDFPTPAEWEHFFDTECRAAAERYLGFPLDPYGRLYPSAIYPSADGWARYDRTVWCGVGISVEGGSTEDARVADQEFRYAVGDCLLVPTEGWRVVVPCDQPHHQEVTAQLDLSDLATVPGEDVVWDRCRPTYDTFLGHPPVLPWQGGYDTFTPESWDAGARVTHCFVGQWDAAGALVAVTGSARG